VPVGTIPDPHATEGGDLVGAERRPVRSRRSGPGAAQTVAVTGAANGAGAAIVDALLRRVGTEGGPAAVIAVDAEQGCADGVSWRLGDLESSSDLLRCLAGATTVVHVAAPTDLAADLLLTPTRRRARAVRSVQEVCSAAAAVGARRLLVVTSAMVYGARADNPVPLPDDAPLRAEPDDGVIGDLLEVERILHRSPRVHPELRITVLRPAALVGPGIDTLVTRHFEAPRLLSLRGGVMRWQFLHTEDLGSAVAVALEHDLDGVLTAGSADWLSADQAERSAGMRRGASARARLRHRRAAAPGPGAAQPGRGPGPGGASLGDRVAAADRRRLAARVRCRRLPGPAARPGPRPARGGRRPGGTARGRARRGRCGGGDRRHGRAAAAGPRAAGGSAAAYPVAASQLEVTVSSALPEDRPAGQPADARPEPSAPAAAVEPPSGPLLPGPLLPGSLPDALPVGPSSAGPPPAGGHPVAAVHWRTGLLLASAFSTVALLSLALLLPVPFVVLRPGPAINTLGSEGGHPLIVVSGHPSYPAKGTLDLTTVTVSGGPGAHLSPVSALMAWFDPALEVVPEDLMFPKGETAETSRKENEQEMASSQQSATVAALREMGIEVPMELTVDSVDAASPPSTLRPKDVVVAVAGKPLLDDAVLVGEMNKVGPGRTIAVTVRRDGKEQVIQAPTRKGSDGRTLFGIRVSEDFRWPFQVKIQIDHVGGPSAGMMFALGIVDTLTAGDLTGGKKIAGTGTIDENGVVGPIGGIRQKLIGARDTGATWFLAPAENCGEVVGHVPDGLRVVKVADLASARVAVRRIGADQDVAGLPSCG